LKRQWVEWTDTGTNSKIKVLQQK